MRKPLAFLVSALTLLLTPGAHAAPDFMNTRFTVLKVTSLEDSGPGTLRDCVQNPFPRACIFEVSGRLSLKSALVVDRPDLVIAGQTAPSPGIMITDAGIVIKASNVRVEHLQVRVGDSRNGPPPASRDGISVQGDGTCGVVIDHASISFAIDENVSTWRKVCDVTISDSIISEALYHSIHPKGPHSMGMLIGEGARGVKIVGNLFAANNDRNPRLKYGTEGTLAHNVIAAQGGTSSWNGTNLSSINEPDIASRWDITWNVYLKSNNGYQDAHAVYSQEMPRGSKIFFFENVTDKLTNIDRQFISSTKLFDDVPRRYPASQTYDQVLVNAGSRPWDRNAIDEYVIAGVRSGNLPIRNRVGSWPKVAENRRNITIRDTVVSGRELLETLSKFETSAPYRESSSRAAIVTTSFPATSNAPAPSKMPIPPNPEQPAIVAPQPTIAYTTAIRRPGRVRFESDSGLASDER